MHTYRGYTIRLHSVPHTYASVNVTIERSGAIIWERGPFVPELTAIRTAQAHIDRIVAHSYICAPVGQPGQAIPAIVVTCYICRETEVLLDNIAGEKRASAWEQDANGWRHKNCSY